ncbi:MAG: DUF1080 domain-containing protein [Bacteroidota bacterium]|nr:DUF1080 domain-containing protein [Bacteroidota bacterium]
MKIISQFFNLVFIYSIFFIPSGLFAQATFPGSEAIGKWNITVQTKEGKHPAWLDVQRSGIKTLVGHYVGADGSARPISEIKYSEGDKSYSFSIPQQWKQSDNDVYIQFRMSNDEIIGKVVDIDSLNFKGVRAPDLVREGAPKWGKPMSLLDKNMTKWIIPENNQFKMEDGVMINKAIGGNLITKEKFNDFKIQLEFRYPENSNSGVYLRGRYEVQIADYHGKKPHDQSIGGIYGFISPTVNAARKANEWQTMDITLVGRMVTIILNGVEVVCSRSIPGITGGALDSDEGLPGPLMLQGDHGPVEFRKIEITPSVN